jgi:hypothetical protein
VDSGAAVAVVSLLSSLAVGAFGKRDDVAKVPEVDGNCKGVVDLLSWSAAGSFGEMEEGVANESEPEVEGNWKGFFAAVDGELLGLKIEGSEAIDPAGMSVFDVVSSGFEKSENGDAEAAKGFEPEDNIELELVGATGSFAAVETEGNGLLGGNKVDGAAAGGTAAAGSVLGNGLSGFGKADGVRANGLEVDGVDEGIAGFVKGDACFSPPEG